MKCHLSFIFLLIALFSCQNSDKTVENTNNQTIFEANYQFPIQYIWLSSKKMAYIEEGNAKQSIIFLHGIEGSLAQWEINIDSLKRNYRCFAIDFLGFGASEKVFDTQQTNLLDFYAQNIIDFIEKKKLEKVNLIGNDFGAQVAILVLAKRPDLVKKTVLVSPLGFETLSMLEIATIAENYNRLFFENLDEEGINEQMQKRFFRMPFLAQNLVKNRLKLKNTKDFVAYCAVQEQCIKAQFGRDMKLELNAILAPTLLVFGKNDLIIPNKEFNSNLSLETLAKKAQNQIKNSELRFFEAAGHWLATEKPLEFNLVLTEFLEKKK